MTEPVVDPAVDPNPDPDPTPDTGADRKFTQADVDRILQERIARVKATPPSDYEELKAAKARLEELEAANLTELERERAARTAAEERAVAVEAEGKQIKLRSAILAEAAKPDRKVVDPDLVATLLAGDVEVDADGNPTNVAKAMDSLLEQRPYLVAATGGSRGSADQGARGGSGNQLTREDLQKMTSAEIVKAQDDGRLDHMLGKT